MRIRALLVGCEGKGDEYLPGVSKDINSIYNYLLSNRGGRWVQDEIIKIETSNKSNIENILSDIRLDNNDFVFVYFAGHGSYSSDYGRKFYVNESQYLTQDSFNNLANKQIGIYDTCADIERTISEKYEFGVGNEVFDSIHSYYRNKYLDWIRVCSDQHINLYACSVDESSGETEKGGYFTQALIDSAIETETDLSILQAFELANPKVIRSSGQQQHPAYDIRPRSGKKLPFSVV